MWAVGGGGSPPEEDVKLRDGGWKSPLDMELLFELRPPKFGRVPDAGVTGSAPGHPHSYPCAGSGSVLGSVYAGRYILACVAMQERRWMGESMEISKWRFLVGLRSSGLDRRSRIYEQLSERFPIKYL